MRLMKYSSHVLYASLTVLLTACGDATTGGEGGTATADSITTVIPTTVVNGAGESNESSGSQLIPLSDNTADPITTTPVINTPEPPVHLNSFSENFETEMEGRDRRRIVRDSGSIMNVAELHKFTVFGLIDLIENEDTFGLTCRGRYCIDLDGTDGNQNPASILTSDKITLDEGSYILTVELGGNDRIAAPDKVRISIAPYFSEVITLQRNDTMKEFPFPFTTTGSGDVEIVIESIGLSDGSGALLDNVLLEPGSYRP